MKYYEVFTDGMPMSLYKMTEEERLRQNFNIKGENIIEYCEPDEEPDMTHRDKAYFFGGILVGLFFGFLLGLLTSLVFSVGRV